MRTRTPTAVLLGLLLASAAYTQTPGAVLPKDPPKTDPKSDPKDMGKDMTKGPPGTEPQWPLSINGKDIHGWLKEATDSPDPAVREFALKTLPSFGPAAQKVCAKKLLGRMAPPSSQGEDDPGVRITLFNVVATIGFENPNDEKEAIRILGLTANTAARGGLARLHAVQTLGLIGPKAEGAVSFLVGPPCEDSAYETRRSVASALGRIGFNETTGPNTKALGALSGPLARDVSAAVRMEALQSLVLLGPPWAAKRQPNGPIPPVDPVGAKVVADNMRTRLGYGTAKKTSLETDKQLEIWCRVVLMRFDPKEITDEHLGAIAKHLDSTDIGAKLQALQGIALLGENGAKRIDDVVNQVNLDKAGDLEDIHQLVFTTALSTLREMGVEARPAIPALEKVEKKLDELKQKRMNKDEFKKWFLALKPEEKKLVEENLPEELLKKVVAATIKWIKDSKPGLPGGDRTAPPPPAEPPKKEKQ
jgi:hypothetical protein